MIEADGADGEHHLGLEFFSALEPAVGDRGADGFLNFLLRGDAHHFEEFAQRHVEGFFVHRRAPAKKDRWAHYRPARNALKAPYPARKTAALTLTVDKWQPVFG